MLCVISLYTPVNTKHLYNICTMLDRRRRRWADVVQMLYKCFVPAGTEFSVTITVERMATYPSNLDLIPVFYQRWASVVNGGPMLSQHWGYVFCSLCSNDYKPSLSEHHDICRFLSLIPWNMCTPLTSHQMKINGMSKLLYIITAPLFQSVLINTM